MKIQPDDLGALKVCATKWGTVELRAVPGPMCFNTFDAVIDFPPEMADHLCELIQAAKGEAEERASR